MSQGSAAAEVTKAGESRDHPTGPAGLVPVKVATSFSVMDPLLPKDGGQVFLARSSCSASLVLLRAARVSSLD